MEIKICDIMDCHTRGVDISVFYSDTRLSTFGHMPGVFLPVLAMLIFVIYDKKTVAGRRGKILAYNQTAGVNIGINEYNNTFASYLFSGLIIGCASIIYVSQNRVNPRSGLSTSGIDTMDCKHIYCFGPCMHKPLQGAQYVAHRGQ